MYHMSHIADLIAPQAIFLRARQHIQENSRRPPYGIEVLLVT